MDSTENFIMDGKRMLPASDVWSDSLNPAESSRLDILLQAPRTPRRLRALYATEHRS
jgi:hypothetical protein